MNDKSHVSMEQKVCVVCTTKFDSGAILLDRRLKQSMERYTTTGWGMCPECDKLRQAGYVALVGCDSEKSEIRDGIVDPSGAYRTGKIVHIKEEAFVRVFNAPVPRNKVVFSDQTVLDKLEKMKEGKDVDEK